MNEFTVFQPVEVNIFASTIPAYVFGNGLKIERRSFGTYSVSETNFYGGNTSKIFLLKRNNVDGMQTFNLHFTPRTVSSSFVTNSLQVLPEEKNQLRLDCLEASVSLALALKDKLCQFEDVQQGENFHLLMKTNVNQVAFLMRRCGFKGNPVWEQAWTDKDTFSSETNIEYMRSMGREIQSFEDQRSRV